MATNDLLIEHGGKAANFLDLSGSATHDQVIEIIHMMMTLDKIKVITINVWAGIFRCEQIGDSLALYAKFFPINKPVLVRLCGAGAEAAN